MFRLAYNFLLRFIRFAYDIQTHIMDYVDMAHDRHNLIYMEREGLPKSESYTRAAVVALYPDEDCLLSTLNLLKGLAEAGFFIVCVSAKKVSPAAAQQLLAHGHHLIERYNIGRDFGSYQTGLRWVEKQPFLQNIDTLALINDSLFYPASIGATIKELLAKDGNWLGLFENFDIRYHMQSFFEVFRAPVFKSAAFRGFWRDYKTLSSRTYVIRDGEGGLSKALMGAGFLSTVLYDSEHVKNALMERLSAPVDDGIALNRLLCLTLKSQYTELYNRLGRYPAASAIFNHQLASEVGLLTEQKNPTHYIGLLCNYLFQAPIKCDICIHNSNNSIADVLTLAQGFPPEEMAAMKRCLHRKGVPASRPKWSWIGIKTRASIV